MTIVPWWQISSISLLFLWIQLSRRLSLSASLRSALRPFIARQVHSGISTILRFQKMQRYSLDVFFGALAVLVSKEFYTFFLPFLFWSGHCELARQMTLLMAFSIYIGNCVKDTISAPRPPSPPVRRLTATDSEKDFALEYGLPSSHTINTICLLGYLLVHIIDHANTTGNFAAIAILTFFFITFFTITGRLYLGMHSPIDILAGILIGILLLTFWCFIDASLDYFIISGQNVEYYWSSISFLLLFAYPRPEVPTPSFEFHTAFLGVALGVVLGVHRTYSLYHHENVADLIVVDRNLTHLLKRLLVGFPVVLAAKVISKELAKILLPPACNFIGIPVKSSTYLASDNNNEPPAKQSQATLNKKSRATPIPFLAFEKPLDIDTGIRLMQYTGLGWSVVELVPYIFEYFRL